MGRRFCRGTPKSTSLATTGVPSFSKREWELIEWLDETYSAHPPDLTVRDHPRDSLRLLSTAWGRQVTMRDYRFLGTQWRAALLQAAHLHRVYCDEGLGWGRACLARERLNATTELLLYPCPVANKYCDFVRRCDEQLNDHPF